jgi:hypothetical protein
MAKSTRTGGTPFTLGRVWHLLEEPRGSRLGNQGIIESVWTRRGDTNTFDSAWGNEATGERGSDVIVLTSKGFNSAGEVILDSVQSRRRYRGEYEVGKGQYVRGSATDDWSFQAEIFEDARLASMSSSVLQSELEQRPVPSAPVVVPPRRDRAPA